MQPFYVDIHLSCCKVVIIDVSKRSITFSPFPSLFSPELSVFDLLGDDGSSSDLEKIPVYEAHVAFAVEGKALLDF